MTFCASRKEVVINMGKLIRYEGKGCAIEHLIFEVDIDDIQKFIDKDHEIWTKKLCTYSGFMSKEIWVSEMNPNQIHTIIYWEKLELWEAIPHNELEAQEAIFREAMGNTNYRMIAATHTEELLYRKMKYTIEDI